MEPYEDAYSSAGDRCLRMAGKGTDLPIDIKWDGGKPPLLAGITSAGGVGSKHAT